MFRKSSKPGLTPVIYSFEDHNIQLQDFSPNALSVVKALRNAGHTAYIVGGCIRDLLLSNTPKDFDISTSAKPEEIKAVFRNCILVGRRFRLAHVRFANQIIEVSTFRSGSNEEDALITKDDLWGSPEEDVLRRDFTINGLFYDPSEESIIDYTGGVSDLRNRYLRTIGDPVVRFKQDPVRMLRLLKILSRFSFDVDPKTLDALQECRWEIVKSSPVRVFEEMIKVLGSGASEQFFRLAAEYNLLEVLFPYMDKAFRLNQTLREQTFSCLEALDKKVQKKQSYERHELLAILLFPLVNFNVRYKFREQKNVPIASVFDYIRNFLGQFFADSFTSCSKKNFILSTLILQMQYRLTPLSPTKKVSFFNKKLLKHVHFSDALSLLDIRRSVYPGLNKIYMAWSHYSHKSHNLTSSKK